MNTQLAWMTIGTASLMAIGCSKMEVRKVPVTCRIEGSDCQQGFRYYLNRPYLVVKKPILLYEKKSLVKLSKDTITFLHSNEQIDMSTVKVRRPDKTFTTPTPDELQAIANGTFVGVLQFAGQEACSVTKGDVQICNQAQLEQIQRQIRLLPSAQLSPEEGTRSSTGTTVEGAPATATSVSTASLDVPSTSTQDDSSTTGDMQIIYLPDLDEQYAINPRNCLAKTAVGLTFKNGSELVDVQGEHDSTTLTLSLLDQIQTAIGVAQGVAQEEIKQEAKVAGGGGTTTNSGGTKLTLAQQVQTGAEPVYQLIEKVSIRPGVYRLNKPWEISATGADYPVGSGLLVKLGLPQTRESRFERIGQLQAP